MSTADDDALAEAAGTIADGGELDWDTANRSADGARWRALGRVGRIAGAWRAVGVHADDPASGPQPLFRWGDLEIRELLGEGSFGEVFTAWDPSLHRDVALKLRRGDAESAIARRQIEEARRLARVRHLNVLTIHGVDVRDGRAGLWTDLIRGRTLEQRLAEHGPLGAHEAALIGLDLCRALAAVHAAGLVHGDVKATNVMREEGGRIVLMDFGSVSEPSAGTSGPRTGTPRSSAPETLRGAPLTPAADVYSLGVLLFRLVTGRSPVDAPTLDELLRRHERGERESLRVARPDLPTAFVTAVDRALEPDPARRFADVGALERVLAASLEPAVGALPAPAAVRRGRSPALWLAAAAALIVVAILALRMLGPGRVQPAKEPIASGPAEAARGGAAGTAAPPATPPSAPARTTQTPLVAEATLWRIRDSGREPLEPGGTISPGDHLSLDWRGTERAWVYVLDEDQQGETFTLFPVAGSDLANPLPAGAQVRLPGRRDGAPFDWVVTSAGGREDVLIVASRTPVAVLERQVSALPPADPGRGVSYAQLSDQALATLRGIGGMAPGRADEGPKSRLEALAASLASRNRDFWVRHLVLESH